MTRSKKIYSGIFILLVLGCVYVSTALPVDNRLTSDDIIAIKTLDVADTCTKNVNRNFEDEIECIQSLQSSVQDIGFHKCAHGEIIEPSEFIRRDYGCCFERARFIEKAARYFGFETRHVFIIRPTGGYSLTNLLPLNQKSHATSEILTKNGWLGVDSNKPFILLDAENSPFTYKRAIEDLSSFPALASKAFYKEKPDVIYGLYSRHGKFHGVNLPGPEYVFSELLWNWK